MIDSFKASNIVLVWINIANSVSILSNESTLPRVRLVLRAIQMYGVCLVVIILSTRNLTVGGVGLMPVLGGILALYVIGEFESASSNSMRSSFVSKISFCRKKTLYVNSQKRYVPRRFTGRGDV